MLIRKEDSCVVVVDMQQKVLPLVLNSKTVVDNARWVVQLANTLEIPLMVTEQYPRGLGSTVSELEIKQDLSIGKTDFSCCSEEAFMSQLHALKKKQVILLGIETHVCILQSALALKEKGFDVYIIVDAVSARFKLDHKMALKRLYQAGCYLVTREMVFFEWLRHARGPQFKGLSQTFIKGREDEIGR